ncbi:MAG: hypothetical protein ACR2M4_11395 [Actinomycetota bacterium]
MLGLPELLIIYGFAEILVVYCLIDARRHPTTQSEGREGRFIRSVLLALAVLLLPLGFFLGPLGMTLVVIGLVTSILYLADRRRKAETSTHSAT